MQADIVQRITVKLTRVLLSQLGDIFFVKNVLLGGQPVSQQQEEQDGDCDEDKQFKSRSDKRHGCVKQKCKDRNSDGEAGSAT